MVRGASLSVLVASSRDSIPGHRLVAIGLAEDEQLDIEGDNDDDVAANIDPPATAQDGLRGRSIAMYPLLTRMPPRRTVVIQASGDGYLPAARARELFGPDSTMKRLVAIDARNHRFSGGEPGFIAGLVEALGWVCSSEEGR